MTLCITATLGAQVVDAPLRLEHFQCYPVIRSTPDINVVVELSDQFNTNLQKAFVRDARWFCNPTRKLHNGQAFGVRDIRQHLTFYWTPTITEPTTPAPTRPEPKRIVKIQNQFGQQTLRTHESLFLAVPTKKAVHDFPQDLDHFKCYRATGRRVRRPSVGLSDQFILPVTRHRVRKPVAFCNPTRKLHGDIIATPINNAQAHLTCYSMTAGDDFIGQTGIRNQFGAQGLLVGTPRVLCVPTRKLGFEVLSPDGTEPSPDGTVGGGLSAK